MKNCSNNGFTLTSTVGDFIFECDVPMSHAKLIRDQIMVAVCGVGEGGIRPPTPEGARAWILDHMNGPAKDTLFTWRR